MSPENVFISVVLPAYNEARRLPAYLASIRAYFDGWDGCYEVIVVDDGSDDGLQQILAGQSAGWPQLRTVCHSGNQGKGAAVRSGVLASRGQLVLFADADGATPIDQERLLRQAICEGADVAVGSRRLASPAAHRSRQYLRAVAGRFFAIAASSWFRLGVGDPQCGFKMFRGDAGRQLFEASRERGYLFDLEILVLAVRADCKISEAPISWHEVRGGHFSLIRVFPSIPMDLWRLHRRLTADVRNRSAALR